MNVGTYGLPSSFRVAPTRALAMVQVTFGQDSNTAAGSALGSEVFSALNPFGLTANNSFLAGYTLRVVTPSGGAIHARAGLRADGMWGVGGGSYGTWRISCDLNTGNFSTAGDITATGNVTAYSDPRLKTDMHAISEPLDKVRSLEGLRFQWRSDLDGVLSVKAGKHDYGLRSDQVAAIMPEAVVMGPKIDGESYQMVAYDKIIPLLVEAVKELSRKLEAAESRIISLQNQVSKL